jgi:hypothetical protein
LEAIQVTGYPEEQLPMPETVRGTYFITPQEENLDHGGA